MHEIGGNGKDYKGMFMDSSLVNLPPGCKVILPTAPKKVQSASLGSTLTSWFNIKTTYWPQDKEYLTAEDLKDKYDQAEMMESIKKITKYITEET